MEGFQAYGAGKAGEAFDPLAFFRQPQTVLRVACWLCSVVILGCVANEGYANRPKEEEEFCIFNRNQHACSYAIAIATLCFLCSSGLLALDAYFPQITGVKDRKKTPPPPGAFSLSMGPSLHPQLFILASVWVLSPISTPSLTPLVTTTASSPATFTSLN
uniref:Synaptogyrin 1 n=1 Tax=Sander lucioperca TaxID=283035 RepID=A0A8D0A324_SANLU